MIVVRTAVAAGPGAMGPVPLHGLISSPAGAPIVTAAPAAWQVPSESSETAGSATATSVGLLGETACATPMAPPAQPASPAVSSPVSGAQRAVYSASSYWDGRYAQRATHFDWFFSYSAVRPLLRHAMTLPALPALHVGCGNSDLSIGLGHDGTPVVNTDISPVVIAQMLEDAASWPDGPSKRNCTWEVADCRAMPQYEDDTFGTVVDKGTLDAVLCSGTGLGDVRCYVSEAHRVLVPGGVFLLISLGQPEARLAVLRAQPRRRRPSSADAATTSLLWSAATTPMAMSDPGISLSARIAAQVAAVADTATASPVAMAGCAGAGRREVRWHRVLVYLLPKPSLYLQNEASLLGRRLAGASNGATPKELVGKDEPVSWLGPYEVGPELEEVLASPGLDPRDYFYAYACIKAGATHASTRRKSNMAKEAFLGASRQAAAAEPAEGGAEEGACARAAAECPGARRPSGCAPVVLTRSPSYDGVSRP